MFIYSESNKSYFCISLLKSILIILFSHLVSTCLEALKCILPAPLVIQTHLACYVSAQVPHSQDSGGEWTWFTHCVLDLMGYTPDSKEKVNTYRGGNSVRSNTLVQACCPEFLFSHFINISHSYNGQQK